MMQIPGILAQRRHSGGAGAFPTVRAIFTGFSTGSFSHNLVIPGEVQEGDRIFALFILDGNNGGAAPSGWTQLHAKTLGSNFSKIGVFYRDRQAGDASFLNWSSSSTCNSSQIGIAIAAGSFDLEPPVSAETSLQLSTHTCPSVSDPAGSAAQLVIAALLSNNSSAVNQYPLSDNNTTRLNSSSPYERASLCTANINAAEVSPGDFNLASIQWAAAITILVRGT